MSVLCERTQYVQKDGEIIKILKVDLDYFLVRGWERHDVSKTQRKISP